MGTELDDTQTPVSVVADFGMELIDRLNDEHPDGWELGEIIVVVEVQTPDGKSKVDGIFSETRPYVNRALLTQAILTLEAEHLRAELEDDADEQ